MSQFSNLKSFREALSKKKLQDKFYKSSGMNTSKSVTRGGSITDRERGGSIKGGSLLTKKSIFRSSKNSDGGIVGGSDLRLASNLGNLNYQTYGNISDSDQMLLLENANHI